MLQRWWATKYRLPSIHELFQAQTVEDLLTEFWTDIYEKHPLEMHRTADGNIQLKDTGDPYIDKWEEELAKGLHPDLTEMFTPEQLDRYKKLRVRSQGAVRDTMLQEAVDAAAANHPLERKIRAHREAQTSNTSRFPRTFGDDD